VVDRSFRAIVERHTELLSGQTRGDDMPLEGDRDISQSWAKPAGRRRRAAVVSKLLALCGRQLPEDVGGGDYPAAEPAADVRWRVSTPRLRHGG
jgi:hypothetical protein